MAYLPQNQRKNISIIQFLVKNDCRKLYTTFFNTKKSMDRVFAYYEEFCTTEINTIFKEPKELSNIVLDHREKFQKFIFLLSLMHFDGESEFHRSENDLYCINISVQKWSFVGPSRHGSFYVTDIKCDNITRVDNKSECLKCGGRQHKGKLEFCPAWGNVCEHCCGPNHFKECCPSKSQPNYINLEENQAFPHVCDKINIKLMHNRCDVLAFRGRQWVAMNQDEELDVELSAEGNIYQIEDSLLLY